MEHQSEEKMTKREDVKVDLQHMDMIMREDKEEAVNLAEVIVEAEVLPQTESSVDITVIVEMKAAEEGDVTQVLVPKGIFENQKRDLIQLAVVAVEKVQKNRHLLESNEESINMYV